MEGQGILCFKDSLSKSSRKYRGFARAGVDENGEVRQASPGGTVYGRREARRSCDFGCGTSGGVCYSFAGGSFSGRFRRKDPYDRRICASMITANPSTSPAVPFHSNPRDYILSR